MPKQSNTRLPAIYMDFISSTSWKTDRIYARIAQCPSTRPWLISIFWSKENVDNENGRSIRFLFVFRCLSVSLVIWCLKMGTFLPNKSVTYLIGRIGDKDPRSVRDINRDACFYSHTEYRGSSECLSRNSSRSILLFNQGDAKVLATCSLNIPS